MIRWWPQDILWFDRKIRRPTDPLPVGCAIRVLVLFPLSFEFEFGRIDRARKAGAIQYTNVLVDLVECVDAQELTEPGSATGAMVGGIHSYRRCACRVQRVAGRSGSGSFRSRYSK
jgi:hypothetical protein